MSLPHYVAADTLHMIIRNNIVMSDQPHRVSLKVFCLPHASGLPLPAYETEYSAGMDLRAAVTDPITIDPGATDCIPTGLRIAIPPGYEAQIRPRSGLALKQGIIIPNSPGTIDSDYRGEVRVILTNLGSSTFTVERGMRIAQMVICPVMRGEWIVVSSLPESERGAGGFGHTGTA